VVGEASNGREAVQKVRELHPDLVILDISMPELNGLDATPLVLQASPQTRVLILTMHHAEELVQKTLEAGARGYLLKSDAEEDLVRAVTALLLNETFFTPAVRRPSASKVQASKTRKPNSVTQLSLRETEIVQLLVEGKTNKGVSARLGISVRTVENHRARIMRKLRLRSFSDLVRHAIRNKIVDL
jgi:DNA-binding NarL/FixJ family response regulator